MSKLGISVLDTDFIIKSAVSPSPDQSTLFDIKEHQIKMVDDRDLLELLDKHYPMPARTFLGNLKECCEMFGTDYYEHYYKQLEALLFDGGNIEQFCAKLAAVEEKLKQNCKGGGRSTTLGEIKTALLAAVFSLSNMERVTIFMSDDRRARNFIVSRYSEKYHEIKAISVIGVFYILMKNGMPLEEARRYVDALATKEFRLFDNKKMTGFEIVDGIYANNKLILLVNGMLKARD